jgi:3-dehydroquinate synthase
MHLDTRIELSFPHRVRFTRGAFSFENPILPDLLEPTAEGVARAAVFIDSGVADAWPGLAGSIICLFGTHPRLRLASPPVVLPGGEAIKNDPAHLRTILDAIHEARLCRRSYAIVIGGGGVLDAVGYAAAIAHRGVRLVRFPTTTLSQDDSGVGVKNGINAYDKKNFLGAFAPPYAVINDTEFLRTLSDRDWRSGFSEAVKVALVKDGAFFDAIERAAPAILARDLAVAEPVIVRSAGLHLRHITEGGDPFELTLARPLDFGHWAAHKLEQLSAYELRHGEAVAIGVALDTAYSALAGHLSAKDADRVLACLRALGLPTDHPLLEHTDLPAGLDEFREHLGGRLTISLLNAIGSGFEAHQIDPGRLAGAIAFLRNGSAE